MNKVEKIKAEIERRKNQFVSQAEAFHKIGKEDKESYYAALASNMNSLSCFIDSLEEEPVSNDLEEAACEYDNSHIDDNNLAFKAGAQWQKQQDQSTIELAEDHAMLAGMEKMKEEMIDKACEWLKEHWREYVWLTDNNVIHFGHWEYDFKKAMEE